jgi:hypothetical protein
MLTLQAIVVVLGSHLSVFADDDSHGFLEPQFLRVNLVDRQQNTLLSFVTTNEAVAKTAMKTVTELVDGKPVKKEVPITYVETIPVTVAQTRSLNGVHGFDKSGKKLDKTEMLNRLEKAKVVVVSSDGKRLDPVFSSVLDQNALILVFPTSSIPALPGKAPNALPRPAAVPALAKPDKGRLRD